MKVHDNYINPLMLKVTIYPYSKVHYIVAFYCDRLKDKAIVIPHVLTGMHALVRHCQSSPV